MKNYIFFVLLITSNCFAQNREDKMAVSMCVVALTNHEDIAPFYGLYYQKSLTKKILVSANSRLMWYYGKDNKINQIQEIRRRFTLDLELKIALLKYKNNTLKIGAGPSVWYRNDKLVDNLKYKSAINKTVIVESYQYKFTKGWQLGYNVNTELEMQLFNSINLGFDFGFNQFLNKELNIVSGFKVYFKVPKN